MDRSRRLIVGSVLALVAVGAAVALWPTAKTADTPEWAKPALAPEPDIARQRGGVVNVVTLTPPEYSDTGEGGDTLRQLTWPVPFVAYPDGTWRASLVEPGSDVADVANNRVSFRIRNGAQWSNGSPFTAADLRRTADKRFVNDVLDADAGGRISVVLTQKLPNWRSLWSKGIAPPADGISGGPFVVESVTSGLQTVLRRNDLWAVDGQTANLDEIRLVLASDAVLARLLLRDGKIDVYRPVEASARVTQLQAFPGVRVMTDNRSGIHAGMRFDNGDLTLEERRRMAYSFPRAMFVKSLLDGEAELSNGLGGAEAWNDGAPVSDKTLNGAKVSFGSTATLPLSMLVSTSVSVAATQAGGVFDPAGPPDVILDRRQDGPAVCWTCRFGLAQPDLSRQADSGDATAIRELQGKLRDDGRYLPLWRPIEVMAWRESAVSGVVPNGFTYGNAWHAERWYRAG